jgi:hypothetical protein
VKCSVDKEFAYIFDESANKPLLREVDRFRRRIGW